MAQLLQLRYGPTLRPKPGGRLPQMGEFVKGLRELRQQERLDAAGHSAQAFGTLGIHPSRSYSQPLPTQQNVGQNDGIPMSNLKAQFWTGAAIALWLCMSAAPSEGQALSGPNVVVFPPLGIPFQRSYKVISTGEKQTDGCSFPLDSDAPPNPPTRSQRWITVQRAYDPDTCQELLEKGLIDLSINPEAAELLGIPAQQKGP